METEKNKLEVQKQQLDIVVVINSLPSDESIKAMSEKFGESMYFIEPKTSGIIGFQEGAKAMRDFIKSTLEGNN